MTTTGTIKVEQTRKAKNGVDAKYEVYQDGQIIGLVRKFRGTNQPWKCFYRDGRNFQLFLNVRTNLKDAVKAIVSKISDHGTAGEDWT